MNKLQQLREMTVVVADTGELPAIAEYKPQDAIQTLLTVQFLRRVATWWTQLIILVWMLVAKF